MTRKKMEQKQGGSRRVESVAKKSAKVKSKKASKPKPEGEKNVNE